MFNDIIRNEPRGLGVPNWEKKYNDIRRQIEDLADFIMVEFQDRIGEAGSLGAVDEAKRLLKELSESRKSKKEIK